MNVVLFGATGMVGRGVLLECLGDQRIGRIVAIGRTPTGITHPRFAEVLHADLFDPAPVGDALRGANACFFCLGVSSAGMSEAEYTRLTFDLTLGVARLFAELNPGAKFIYVSGAGTDSTERGRWMWARVKGRTENALRALPLDAYAFRPGYIQPVKGVRSRTRLYQLAYNVAAPLYPLFKRIAARHVVTTEEVGRAMIAAAANGYPQPVLEVVDIAVAAGRNAPR
jgi:uncharacterized protein YbjT (DUF2867 family)